MEKTVSEIGILNSYLFSDQFFLQCSGKFAAGVVDTSGNLPPASLTPVANLTPVSTRLAKMVEKFATGVDTGGA